MSKTKNGMFELQDAGNTLRNELEDNNTNWQVVEDKLLPLTKTVKKGYEIEYITAYLDNPSSTANLFNVNAGSYGGLARIVATGHTSLGNSTWAAIYLVRLGFDGNNYSVKNVFLDYGFSSEPRLTFTVTSAGMLQVQSSTYFTKLWVKLYNSQK